MTDETTDKETNTEDTKEEEMNEMRGDDHDHDHDLKRGSAHDRQREDEETGTLAGAIEPGWITRRPENCETSRRNTRR